MTSPTILITGCSSGIGLCAARMLKERGYRVFAAVRKQADADSLAAQGLESLILDLNDPASIKHGLAEVLKKTNGKLDALFNNAGVLYAGAIEDLTPEMIQAQFQTNTFGPLHLTQLVLPVMRAQGHGRIIQNSSILGIVSMPYYGAYNASKFALEAFSRSLRLELRNTNIFVSIICPGPIYSKLRQHAFQRYQAEIVKQQTGHHKAVYQKLEETYFTEDQAHTKLALREDAVVKELILALESKHPRVHYYVGRPAKTFAMLRRLLPDATLDWLISKIR